MRPAVVGLLLATVSLAAAAGMAAVNTTATTVTQLTTVFGAQHVHAAFGGGGGGGLDAALLVTLSTAPGYRVVCFPRPLPDDATAALFPAYVDDIHACYGTVQPFADTAPRPTVDYLLHPALKIDYATYALVDGHRVGRPDLLTVAFANVSSSAAAISAVYSQVAGQLAAYNLSALEDFFWSTPPPPSPSPPQAAGPRPASDTRRTAWAALTEQLRNATAAVATANGAATARTDPDPDPDPCGFQGLPVRVGAASIALPLASLPWHTDPTSTSTSDGAVTAAACVAYAAATFAAQPWTRLVSVASYPRTDNYKARSLVQTQTVGTGPLQSPYTALGLTGTGQVVALADTGLDVQSCWFIDINAGRVPVSPLNSPVTDASYRKVIQYAFFPGVGDGYDVVGGHGTLVAGTMAGEAIDLSTGAALTPFGAGNGLYNGGAMGAQIAFLDIANRTLALANTLIPPPTAAALYGPGRLAGARVHSNSWGSGFTGGQQNGQYTEMDADTDRFLVDHPDQLIVFAGGNLYDISATTGTPNPLGLYTVTRESTAKNVVSVGASATTEATALYVAKFSGRGPLYDGRFAPSITAPGTNLFTARGSGYPPGDPPTCTLVPNGVSGTSLSAPVVAAAAILLRQYLTDASVGRPAALTGSVGGDGVPSGVVLKALLLHSGSPMVMVQAPSDAVADVPLGPPPDSSQGYGLLRLSTLLDPATALFARDVAAPGSPLRPSTSAVYTITVSSPTVPLKVTVVWYDPPAPGGTTAKALLNDLDVVVSSPCDGNGNGNPVVYKGNGKGPGAASDPPDTLNPTEQVTVGTAALGGACLGSPWTVAVTAQALMVGPAQPFALAVTAAAGSAVVYVGTSPPTATPTRLPTAATPTRLPTATPTRLPTAKPTRLPTAATPTRLPTAMPTRLPTAATPTASPSAATAYPIGPPVSPPTATPTHLPTTPIIPTATPTVPIDASTPTPTPLPVPPPATAKATAHPTYSDSVFVPVPVPPPPEECNGYNDVYTRSLRGSGGPQGPVV